jgi:hypothetical protein
MKSPTRFLDHESGDGMSDVQKVETQKVGATARYFKQHLPLF